MFHRFNTIVSCAAIALGAYAQGGGLTDMSDSRHAVMVNTPIDAVKWTGGFWGERFDVYSGTSLESMWETWSDPDVSHGFRNFEIALDNVGYFIVFVKRVAAFDY
ncbi:MAG: glycoside hydrolase family 127 protein, partial [Duncaniella sp.]|nr:glycoside hydrolase family 127 protein [Duncaniella sp.]